jgi:aspartyl-tRNA(Asn)/glutamyl-tRNA(Gln) amidotransferase subunit B
MASQSEVLQSTQTPLEYETVIGLEVHVQLLTHSKMFCDCSADYAYAPPNTHVCPVCMGMPGVLPVINRKAIEYAVMTGLALHSTIPEVSKFDRKNYAYPDLVKGYQISQYDLPVAVGGWLEVETDGQTRRIGITRAHQEEDTAKLIHRTDPTGESYSLVDINRSGVPLMEIVSEPDIRSPEEARLYLMKLRQILQYLGVSTGSMEEGSFRCDANISVRPVGTTTFGEKVEIKNMNSFRGVERALEYEVERQIQVLRSGGRIIQETRGWVDERGVTVSQRTKEFAHDYRYFPEPDLPPMYFSREWVGEVERRLPELPEARRNRFIDNLGLTPYDADLLTATRATADFFEAALDGSVSPDRAKAVSNWMQGELFRLLNETGTEIESSRLRPEHLTELLDLLEKGTISGKIAKDFFPEMFRTGKKPSDIVSEKGLVQVSDVAEIQRIVEEAVAANPQPVADYLAGKERALVFLVGYVMKTTRGKANPEVVNRLLRDTLDSLRT